MDYIKLIANLQLEQHYSHPAYHSRHCEVTLVHFVGKPIYLPSGVTEDNSLGDGEGFVQITQGLQLPVFLFNIHIELLDT